MDFETIRTLVKPEANSKMVLLIMDGLGGLPFPSAGWQTALEAAQTPHMDALAERGTCGLHLPVASGITPGSGPAHLALFGYDPIRHQVGRGVLSALGIGFDLQPGDVAARGNFCTVDESGLVTNRRAGRIPTEKGQALCALLREHVELDGVEVFIQSVKGYRFLLVLRGEGLDATINETDPLRVGQRPRRAEAQSPEAQATAGFVRAFVDQARDVLADQDPANMVLLRGFAQRPKWPTMHDVFGLRAVAIAGYPMYRGVARLVGMQPIAYADALTEAVDLLRQHWDEFDFFFVHVKPTDSAGEDGDFDKKKRVIEEVDGLLPQVLDLNPDVIVITGDHSTPARLKYHSWHPVPALLWSETCRSDRVTQFHERACIAGGLGPRFPATDLLPLMLAHAGRLDKFGA